MDQKKAFSTFPSLSLATAEDVPRLAEICALGFKADEDFRSRRPLFDKYPEDEIAAWANTYLWCLKDPDIIVVVAEDYLEQDELLHPTSSQKSTCEHDHDPAEATSFPTERIVVGTATWKFPEGILPAGQLVVPHVSDTEPIPDRDIVVRRPDTSGEKKFLAVKVVLFNLVVHPSYWRRGHARAMIRWGQRLCDKYGIDQALRPSRMGEPMYLYLGYKRIGEFHVPADGDAEGFSARVLGYEAKGGAEAKGAEVKKRKSLLGSFKRCFTKRYSALVQSSRGSV